MQFADKDERMSEKQDFSDIGEKIKNAVQDAVESGNFGQMNYVVKDTIDCAMDEVRRQVSQAHDQLIKFNRENIRPERTERQKKLPAAYIYKRGRVSGILLTVFGSIGTGIFGFLAFLILVAALVTWNLSGIGATLILAVPGVFSAGLLRKGCSLRARLQRAERYLKLTGEKMYMELGELAARTGQSVRRVRKDLRSMLNAGIFPQGHMDLQETVFVLDDETWEQYLSLQREWEKKQLQEEAGQTAVFQDSPEEEIPEEIRIEHEGREYMDRLRQLNLEIAGETISNKLYQLDYLLQRIFAVLKEHPEKCPQMRKFMDYYLPTTVKLVESYADFDKAGIRGENIMSAKTEIEKTLDTINQAFAKLLDDMYQTAAFEAAADAKALKTILMQDGYMKSEFSERKEKGKEA